MVDGRDQVIPGANKIEIPSIFGDTVLQFRFINENHLFYGDYPLSALLHPLAS
jgi:hypothetical protein